MSIRFESRLLVIFTACVFLLTFSFLVFFHKAGYEKPIPLYTTGQPTIGNPSAKVHVVVFEDPKCNNCIVFHQQTYSLIYDNFIKRGLIRYTVYLLGELSNSDIISKTLLCVNNQSTSAFFDILNLYYTNPPLALTAEELRQDLLRLIKNNPVSINMNTLQKCSSSDIFGKQVIENTSYAKAIMGGVIKTPTVFVNGIRLLRPTYAQLEKLILLELKKAGS